MARCIDTMFPTHALMDRGLRGSRTGYPSPTLSCFSSFLLLPLPRTEFTLLNEVTRVDFSVKSNKFHSYYNTNIFIRIIISENYSPSFLSPLSFLSLSLPSTLSFPPSLILFVLYSLHMAYESNTRILVLLHFGQKFWTFQFSFSLILLTLSLFLILLTLSLSLPVSFCHFHSSASHD